MNTTEAARCPGCNCGLVDGIMSHNVDCPTFAARLLASKRKTLSGGRPRSRKPRCACGAMTLKRALARCHKC